MPEHPRGSGSTYETSAEQRARKQFEEAWEKEPSKEERDQVLHTAFQAAPLEKLYVVSEDLVHQLGVLQDTIDRLTEATPKEYQESLEFTLKCDQHRAAMHRVVEIQGLLKQVIDARSAEEHAA